MRPARARAAQATAWIIALATGLRLAAAAVVGLSVDESYMVAVSRPFTLSYFDHPPLSFWLPGLVAGLTGTEAALVLRLPFILLFAGTSWLMYRLTERLFCGRAGVLAVLLLSVAPVFSFSTGGWVLPDGPLMFFMLAAALALERVLPEGDTAHAWRWWLAAGAFTGLAMLSKYHGVFVVLGALLYVATRRESRFWLRRPQPYVAAGLALALFTPVLLWNVQQHWLSFRFQGGRGAPDGLHPLDLLRSLGGQAAYLLPWLWLPAAWLLLRGLAGGPRHARRWFLVCLAIGPIAFFTLPALGGRPGLPHWEAPGWLFTFPLLGALADRGLDGSARVVASTRAWLAGSVAGYALIWLLAVSQMATGWVSRVEPSWFGRGDPSWEVVDWTDLRAALRDRGLPAGDGFVAATRWMDAGKAAYALGPDVPVTCLCSQPHHFHFTAPQQRFLGRTAVLVLPPNSDTAAAGRLAAHFRSLEPLGSVTVHRHGRAEFRLPLYLGRDLLSTVPLDLAR